MQAHAFAGAALNELDAVYGENAPQARKALMREMAEEVCRAAMELDVRGQTSDEALMNVDQFIDSAVLAGINMLTIIHGKGTGALRAAVQQHLKRHPNVKSFRLGTFGEGEAGVTIVELK